MYKFIYFNNNNPIEITIDENGLTKRCPYMSFNNEYSYKDYELKIVDKFEPDKYYLCMHKDILGFKKPDDIFIHLGNDYSIYNYTVDQQLKINIYYKLGKLFMSSLF